MTHIEFLGPPGAGKSTIFTRLIASDTFYGGTKDDAVRRVFFKKAGPKYRLPYRITPSPIRDFLEDAFMQYRFGHSALEDFIRNHPDFVELLSVAMNSVSHEPEKVFSYCKSSAERYQLGVSTVSETETLCLDESFAQRALAILWRQPDELFSLDEYFDTVPISDLVVYVDAPVDLCIERQQKRGRIAIEKDWETDDLRHVQKKTRRLSSDIHEHLNDRTSLITVENTGGVDETVEQILSEIHNSSSLSIESDNQMS